LSAGSIFVTLTDAGLAESGPVSKSYAPEADSPAPDRSRVRITNRAGQPDEIRLEGVQPGDVIRVYADPSAPAVLTENTVPAGQSAVVLQTAQLGTDYGIVYLSLTRGSLPESLRIPKVYA